VVGAVEVLAGAIPEVRPHDRDPAAWFHRGAQLAERGRDRVLVGQVLEEVRKEHAVEVAAGQVGVHDVGDDRFDPGGVRYPLVDWVDAPAFGGGHRGDELASASGRVKDALGGAHPAVCVARDLLPHRLPAGLVDVTEPVGVQPLIVDASRRRLRCVARCVPELRVQRRLGLAHRFPSLLTTFGSAVAKATALQVVKGEAIVPALFL
jgi:hypothetical protein